MSMTPARTDATTPRTSPLLRGLAWFVLTLMAAATLYTGYIAVVNFHRIGV